MSRTGARIEPAVPDRYPCAASPENGAWRFGCRWRARKRPRCRGRPSGTKPPACCGP